MGWMEILIIVVLGVTLFTLVLVLRRMQAVQRDQQPPQVTGAMAGGAGAEPASQAGTPLSGRALPSSSPHLEESGAAALGERLADLESRRELLEQATADVEDARTRAEHSLAEERESLRGVQRQLDARETSLARREEQLAHRWDEVEARVIALGEREAVQRAAEAELRDRHRQAAEELSRIAGLSADQARREVIERAEHEARLEAARLVRDIEREAQQEAERRARGIVVSAIQRLAVEHTADAVISVVHLPSDEMKGRIIGREGRNIRTFEQVTGVNVMIDDTPETVLLSSFDPVRREVARLTLEALVADGRIHPTRIEEVHERSTEQVADRCLRSAEDALAQVGISDLDPALIPILGSLRYRTSYGQNVLEHLIECAHLAGLMAAELGLDPTTSKRAAFLHDIGKALTHEVEGPHAEIGAELCRRHGEVDDVVHAIAAHHNEIEPQTVEALLVQAADSISGSRPGARRESLEAYIKRLERLEEIALDHEGVERVFAMQSGRELRIMVLPEQVDDLAAQTIARQVARTIEDELTYPGQIKVTVVRESRATETAH